MLEKSRGVGQSKLENLLSFYMDVLDLFKLILFK